MISRAGHGISVTGLTKSYGEHVLFEDINFEVQAGEFMVIVGPSGCGKSSLMRVIAGIEEHSHGRVVVDGDDVTNAHPGDRRLAMVFQDYALYPHMTVAKNLGFGLRSRGVSRQDTRRRVEATAAIIGLTDQLSKKPANLSGGQRQRVALGRAMVQEPRAFLMDEPLSNLDAALRVQMRGELIEFHRRVNGTVLYVTHDQIEAMTMGDRVAVMNNGRFEQVGSPGDVYARPVNTYVATFLGSPRMNIFDATVTDGEDGRLISTGETTWRCPAELDEPVGSTVRVGVRPESFRLTSDSGADGALDCCVDYVENLGNELILHMSTAGDRSVVARCAPRRIEPRQRVTVLAELHSVSVFAADGRALWHGRSMCTEH